MLDYHIMPNTFKNKFNKKFGFKPDAPHSLDDISKITNLQKKHLQIIYNKGIGAFNTNRSAVRPSVKSADQWATARVYSAVMGGKASIIDASHLIKK